jgi:cytochrome P450
MAVRAVDELTNEVLGYDPLEPGQAADPYPRYGELRARAPVSETMAGFRFIARHADASTALRDASTFSSALGMRIHGQRLDDEDQAINEIDAPRHTKIRRLLISAFSPATVNAAEPSVVALARQLVDALAPRGAVDLVEAFTVPLPITVIATMLGIPPTDRDDFKRWSDDIMINGVYGRDGIKTLPEFHAYLDEQIESRRAASTPSDDLVTKLVEAEVDGTRLTTREIRTQVRFLVMAGNETTTNLIGNTLYELLSRPGLWARIGADRTLVPSAVEETLRYNAPVQFVPRTCTAPVEISGTAIEAEQRVLVGLGSANRDEDVFDAAEEFSVDRGTDVPHLTFGLGPHFCIGAALARMEARVALDALLDRLPDLALAPGFAYDKAPMMMVRGPQRLDVRFTPVPSHAGAAPPAPEKDDPT